MASKFVLLLLLLSALNICTITSARKLLGEGYVSDEKLFVTPGIRIDTEVGGSGVINEGGSTEWVTRGRSYEGGVGYEGGIGGGIGGEGGIGSGIGGEGGIGGEIDGGNGVIGGGIGGELLP